MLQKGLQHLLSIFLFLTHQSGVQRPPGQSATVAAGWGRLASHWRHLIDGIQTVSMNYLLPSSLSDPGGQSAFQSATEAIWSATVANWLKRDRQEGALTCFPHFLLVPVSVSQSISYSSHMVNKCSWLMNGRHRGSGNHLTPSSPISHSASRSGGQ